MAVTCAAHRFHSPRPQVLQQHHVFPSGWGGPDDPSNVVMLCPTGHVNVHRLLDAFKAAGQTPSWSVRRSYGPGERDIAQRGWLAYKDST